MASSFTLTSSSYKGRYMELVCTQTKDIAANKSIISWTLSSIGGENNYYSTGPTSVTINGKQAYYKARVEWDTKTFPAAKGSTSGSVEIDHNGDGSKAISVVMSTAIYSGTVSTYSGTWTLDSIPRKATITAVADFTDQDNPSISFSNPGGFRMDVWLEPNPVGDHLCVRENISNTGSYKWTLTDAERDALRNHCTGTKCTIRVGLYSYVGGTQYADYKDKTFTVKESTATKPTVSMSATLNNGSLPSTFGGMYIQGKSKVDVTISATGKNGATIKSYSAVVDGKTYSSNKFTSDVVQNTGSVKVISYAKDSRGFTGSTEATVNVLAYSKPLVIPLGSENAVLCYRSDGNGNRIGNSTSLWVKAKMSYYDVSKKNTCALQWRYKPVDQAWNDAEHLWRDLIPKTNTATNEYNALIPGVAFELKEAYTVQIRAIDDIGEQDVKTFEIPTQDVALHLGKGGKNVSIGTYCDYSEERTFYSDWKAIFDKEVVIGGMQVVDHIVEKGTSGIWTYEKMASGIAKCWAKIGYTVPLSGVNVRVTVTLNTPFPITFTDVPFCNFTLANQTTWNHVLSSVDFTASLIKAFSVYRMGAGVDVTAGGTADIRVVGYWK